LKVGPGATFALREVLWALVDIERELGIRPRESLKEVVSAAMRRDPRYWKPYYTNPASQALDLQYSLSDRIRYYWNVPAVRASSETLIENLRPRHIPRTANCCPLSIRPPHRCCRPRNIAVETMLCAGGRERLPVRMASMSSPAPGQLHTESLRDGPRGLEVGVSCLATRDRLTGLPARD
jgi:hypothetical protein